MEFLWIEQGLKEGVSLTHCEWCNNTLGGVITGHTRDRTRPDYEDAENGAIKTLSAKQDCS